VEDEDEKAYDEAVEAAHSVRLKLSVVLPWDLQTARIRRGVDGQTGAWTERIFAAPRNALSPQSTDRGLEQRPRTGLRMAAAFPGLVHESEVYRETYTRWGRPRWNGGGGGEMMPGGP